jgi:hypothetical protein
MDTNPDWYHNLAANPEVSVEVGTETYAATAPSLPSEERDRVYATQAGWFPVCAVPGEVGPGHPRGRIGPGAGGLTATRAARPARLF